MHGCPIQFLKKLKLEPCPEVRLIIAFFEIVRLFSLKSTQSKMNLIVRMCLNR